MCPKNFYCTLKYKNNIFTFLVMYHLYNLLTLFKLFKQKNNNKYYICHGYTDNKNTNVAYYLDSLSSYYSERDNKINKKIQHSAMTDVLMASSG